MAQRCLSLKMLLLRVTAFLALIIVVFSAPELQKLQDGTGYKLEDQITNSNKKKYNLQEETADYWFSEAQKTLNQQLLKTPPKGFAKNVILFLGDGMSIPTLTAARTYLGQQNNQPGEETVFSFEKFPYVGLSKTYCVDQQVADSACSATAYLCGVKSNGGTIGLTAAVPLGDCKASLNASSHVESIARWFQKKGRSTGLVTTTKVTDASPAGVYANVAHRDWESDSDIKRSKYVPYECSDLASQLINGPIGKNLEVILGGGQTKFLPTTEYSSDGIPGNRSDGRNLIDEWKKGKHFGQFVSDRTALLNIRSNITHILGLFASGHIPYNLERDQSKVPSLAEMTKAAIKILSKNTAGYFLFVEGGRIDHAHHDNQARKALDETVEFHKAIQAAVEQTTSKDTLIVVTSDHAHTMHINGYPTRGNDILGIAGKADDNMPYTTITYSNGPSYRVLENGQRHNIENDNLADTNYTYPSAFPLEWESHGGDDVAIFALGPWAHLFVGVLEQNVIPHIMAFASCVGDALTACSRYLE